MNVYSLDMIASKLQYELTKILRVFSIHNTILKVIKINDDQYKVIGNNLSDQFEVAEFKKSQDSIPTHLENSVVDLLTFTTAQPNTYYSISQLLLLSKYNLDSDIKIFALTILQSRFSEINEYVEMFSFVSEFITDSIKIQHSGFTDEVKDNSSFDLHTAYEKKEIIVAFNNKTTNGNVVKTFRVTQIDDFEYKFTKNNVLLFTIERCLYPFQRIPLYQTFIEHCLATKG